MTALIESIQTFAAALQVRYPVRLLFISIVCANLGGRMIDVYLPVYIEDLGASGAQIGLFFSMLAGILLAVTLLGGALADAFGYLRTIIVASVAGLVAFVVLIAAGSWPVVLAAVALLYGTSKVVGPAIYAYIAGEISPDERARHFGRLRQFIIGAGVAAPILAGFLAAGWGIRRMIAAAALFYGLGVLARLLLVPAFRGPEEEGEEAPRPAFLESVKSVWLLLVGGGAFLYLFIADGFGDIAILSSKTFFPVYLAGRQVTIAQLGWVGGTFVAAEFVGISLSVRVCLKRGERWAMAAGFMLQAVSLLGFIRSNGLPGFLTAWALVGAGQGMLAPAANALVARLVPEEIRATSFGLIAGGAGLFSLAIPWVAGWAYQHLYAEAPFLLAALFSLAAVPLVLYILPLKR